MAARFPEDEVDLVLDEEEEAQAADWAADAGAPMEVNPAPPAAIPPPPPPPPVIDIQPGPLLPRQLTRSERHVHRSLTNAGYDVDPSKPMGPLQFLHPQR